jgi:hypothetical protein
MGLTLYPGDARFTECELTLLGWTGRSPNDVTAAWRLVNQIEQRDTLRMLSVTWPYRRLMVAAILARAGMSDSARGLLRQVQTQPSADPVRRTSAIQEAYVLLLLKDREAALTRLADYVRVAPQTRAQLAQDPGLRVLRGDPRFEALVGPAR